MSPHPPAYASAPHNLCFHPDNILLPPDFPHRQYGSHGKDIQRQLPCEAPDFHSTRTFWKAVGLSQAPIMQLPTPLFHAASVILLIASPASVSQFLIDVHVLHNCNKEYRTLIFLRLSLFGRQCSRPLCITEHLSNLVCTLMDNVRKGLTVGHTGSISGSQKNLINNLLVYCLLLKPSVSTPCL